LAIGAWLAGLALAAFTLVFWEAISLVIGVVFVGLAFIPIEFDLFLNQDETRKRSAH
jgi:hypothetical protein